MKWHYDSKAKFKKVRPCLQYLLKISVALLIFYGVCMALNTLYVQRSLANDQTRLLWHWYYKSSGKINNIYVGSSHVYCGMNPVMLNQLNGQYNFNLASSFQLMNGSYYLIKEADRDNPLSHIYLELYYRCRTPQKPETDPIDISYFDNWLNTDYMKNSFNKLNYMYSICGTDKYIDMFFPFVRYRRDLDNWTSINKNLEEKGLDSYLSYQWGRGEKYERYAQQGFLCSEKVLSDSEKIYQQKIILNEDPIGKKSEDYLLKIIRYCQKQDIPLTFFVIPTSELELISTEKYDNYYLQVKEIAETYDIPFYDFNLVKDKYLPIQHNEYFQDNTHLNGKGADIFTTFFYEVVSGDIVENRKYFYDSYTAKLDDLSPAVYGLYYKDFGDKREYCIASNRNAGVEYRISVTYADESQGGAGPIVIQEFAENKEFTMPIQTHGVCDIEARMVNGKETIKNLEIYF